MISFIDLVIWTQEKFAPWGLSGLFMLSFIESIFFPVPPDILIVILTLKNPSLFLLIGFVATIGSILGGIGGYYVGYFGKKSVLEKMFSKRKIDKIHRLFERYGAWAVFISGMTPLPYKIFTIGAGVFYINLRKFIIASAAGRAIRFFAVAISVYLYGDSIVSYLDKVVLDPRFLLIIVVAVVLYYYFKYRKRLAF